MAKKKKTLTPVIIILVLVLALIVGGIYGYSVLSADINGTEDDSVNYTLLIEDHDFAYEISAKLMHAGIVKSDTVWNWWMDRHYPDFTYYNGEYNLTSGMSYEEIAAKLQNPDVSHKKVKVCIPEGYNVFEIADTLEKNGICSSKDFLEACQTVDGYDYDWLKDFPVDNKNVGYILEGFLFPATYDLGENTAAHDVADTMLSAFDDRISEDIRNFCTQQNMSLYAFVTLASIVQEEALTKSSQGNIASVLMNRLDKGMKIECDVTYYYAKQLRDNGFSQAVYDAYYTYRCAGLPAGPITNPGAEIMDSTVHHPDTEYIYFFSDLKGDFHFAATYDEFEKLKSKYPWQ